MPNRLTRIPDRPVPQLPRRLAPVVLAADLFMRAALSRPATGSLRRTWVTPATLQLSLAAAVLATAVGVAIAVSAGGPTRFLAALPLLVGLGSASVALVGLAQRRAPPRS